MTRLSQEEHIQISPVTGDTGPMLNLLSVKAIFYLYLQHVSSLLLTPSLHIQFRYEHSGFHQHPLAHGAANRDSSTHPQTAAAPR
jgi:hypothetical protein